MSDLRPFSKHCFIYRSRQIREDRKSSGGNTTYGLLDLLPFFPNRIGERSPGLLSEEGVVSTQSLELLTVPLGTSSLGDQTLVSFPTCVRCFRREMLLLDLAPSMAASPGAHEDRVVLCRPRRRGRARRHRLRQRFLADRSRADAVAGRRGVRAGQHQIHPRPTTVVMIVWVSISRCAIHDLVVRRSHRPHEREALRSRRQVTILAAKRQSGCRSVLKAREILHGSQM